MHMLEGFPIITLEYCIDRTKAISRKKQSSIYFFILIKKLSAPYLCQVIVGTLLTVSVYLKKEEETW